MKAASRPWICSLSPEKSLEVAEGVWGTNSPLPLPTLIPSPRRATLQPSSELRHSFRIFLTVVPWTAA